MVYITFYSSFRIRSHRQTSDRPATLDLQCQDIFVPFHHDSHHRTAGQQTSQSRGCHRAGIMILSCGLHYIFCVSRKGADLSVSCRSLLQYNHSYLFPFFFFHIIIMIPGSKVQKSDASLLAGSFHTFCNFFILYTLSQ